MNTNPNNETTKPIPAVTSNLTPLMSDWGPRVNGHYVRIWGTKKDAIAGAKAIGWRAKSVVKVHTRFQGVWAIAHDGGYLSRDTYGELWHDRNKG